MNADHAIRDERREAQTIALANRPRVSLATMSDEDFEPALRRALLRPRPPWVIRGEVAAGAVLVGSVPAGQARTPREAVAWYCAHRRWTGEARSLRAFPRIPARGAA